MEFYVPLEEQKEALKSVESLTDFIMDNNLDNEWLEFFLDNAYYDGGDYVSEYFKNYYKKMKMTKEEESKDRALWEEDFEGDFPRNVEEGTANHTIRDFVSLLASRVLSDYSVHDIKDIEVWRGIGGGELNTGNLGECWTDNKEVADTWVGGNDLVMHAFVKDWGIDWISSFWFHTVDDEYEIRVCDQRAIESVEVKDRKGNIVYSRKQEADRLTEADKSRFVDKMVNLTDEQKSRFKSALKYDTSLENTIYRALGDWQKSSDWTWDSIEPYVSKAETNHANRIEKDKRDSKVALEEGVDYNVFYKDKYFTVYEVLTYPAMCVIASDAFEPKLIAEIPSWAWENADINEWCEEAEANGEATASGAHWCVALKRDKSHWNEYVDVDGYHMYVGCKTYAYEDDPFGKICFFDNGDYIEAWDANDENHSIDDTGDWANLLNRLVKKIKGVGDEGAYFKAFPEDKGKENGYVSFCEELKDFGVHCEFKTRKDGFIDLYVTIYKNAMKDSLRNAVDNFLFKTNIDWWNIYGDDCTKVKANIRTDKTAKTIRNGLENLLRHCQTSYSKDGRDWVKEACDIIGEEFNTHVIPLGEFEDFTETELNTDDILKGDVDMKVTAVIDRKDNGEFEFTIRVIGEFKDWEEELKAIERDNAWARTQLDVFDGSGDDIMFVYFLSPSSNPREDCKRVFTVIHTILDGEMSE